VKCGEPHLKRRSIVRGPGVRWTLVGLVAGVFVAIIVTILTESLGNQLFGASPDAAPSARASPVTLIFPVAGWFLGTLIGGVTAVTISRLGWEAWVVAGFILAAAGLNFALMRYPAWMGVAALIAVPLAAWIAQRVGPIGGPDRS
jgi:hypothetical protein